MVTTGAVQELMTTDYLDNVCWVLKPDSLDLEVMSVSRT